MQHSESIKEIAAALLKAQQSFKDANAAYKAQDYKRAAKNYEDALKLYILAMCREWRACGFNDSVEAQILARCPGGEPASPPLPPWLGDPAFHLAHQSNLIRKDPDHYAPRFPGVPGDLPYVWPV